jgi:hypothetical protein
MKVVSITKQKVRSDTFADVITTLLSFSECQNVTSDAVEWMGIYFSILIVTENGGTPEETILQIEDLLKHTLMEHRMRELRPLNHVIHESIPYNYCGTSVIHDSMDDAIDYANYMRIRINN